MNAIALTDQEVRVLFRVTEQAGIEVDAPEFKHASESAQRYKDRHGSLDAWEFKGMPLGAELARIDREASAQRKAAIKAAGIRPRYTSASEVRGVLSGAHDACMGAGRKPGASELLRNAGVPAREATKLASKGSVHAAKAWQELEDHPARQAMREQGVLSRRKGRAAVSGSLAGTVAALYSLAGHTKALQRLGVVEDEVTKLKAQIAALETRQTLTEAGEHWHNVARRMLASGDGPTAIASATGQKVNTVKQFVKRNR